jgi:hypothetical protein
MRAHTRSDALQRAVRSRWVIASYCLYPSGISFLANGLLDHTVPPLTIRNTRGGSHLQTGSYFRANHSVHSCVSPRPRPGEIFPAPPSLSVFNAPTATYFWPNFAASSQMKHDPVLYAKYHDMSSSSGSSDTDDSEYGPTEDQHGEFPPSPRYTNPSRTRTSTRESSLETP